MKLPDEFLQSIKKTIPDKAEQLSFFDALNESPPVSIRLNRKKKWDHTSLISSEIPWCEDGYYLKERPVFTLDPVFHAGGYYVQEASSMFIWHCLQSLSFKKKGIKILDLSAAPGGKSTLIASWLGGDGLLVANEIVKSRAYTLKYNIMKEGYANVVVTNNSPEDFKKLKNYFDIILVDAPCSGEGMFRKDPEAIGHWSLKNVENCALRQKDILNSIIPALKEGGVLLYSTCTYNHAENIDQADFLVGEYGMQSVKINHLPSWSITEIHGKNSTGYQFFPHKAMGEGFFVSVFRNPVPDQNSAPQSDPKKRLIPLDKNENKIISDWITSDDAFCFKDVTGTIHLIPQSLIHDATFILGQLRAIYCGISIGTVNKNILIPDHSLALSFVMKKDFPKVELETGEALRYLKKTLSSVDKKDKGWMLAIYAGLHLGFLKNIIDRVNNYLPNEYKILMELTVG